jgi:MFS family permease
MGLVFWYGIEKAFMFSLGFSNSTIIMAVTLMTLTVVVLEFPSGVLADRWGRKNTLYLAAVALAISAFGGAIAHTPWVFLICTTFWAIYNALNSGVAESIVYDLLLEENGNRNGFEKYYGRQALMISLGLVAGSILGGFIGQIFDLRTTFFLSIPSAIIAFICLYFFNEPKLHKASQTPHIKAHVIDSLNIIRRHHIILPLSISVMCITTLYRFIFELYQLWLLPFSVGALFLGSYLALLNSSFGIAGLFAGWIKTKKISLIILISTLMLSLASLWIHSLLVVAVSLMVSVMLIQVINIIQKGLIHDELSSHQRTSVMSAISAFGSVILLVLTGFSSVLSVRSLDLIIPLVLLISLLALGMQLRTKIVSH